MAVALNPQDGYSHKNLSAILSRSGARAESIKHLRRATELLPSDPSTCLNLGLILEDEAELDEADEAYLKELDLDPTGQLGQRAEKTLRGRGGPQSTWWMRGGRIVDPTLSRLRRTS
jgi:tetratricopeptide (TPR) repeat protein